MLNVMLNCRNLNLNLIQLIAHTHAVDNHDDDNDDDDVNLDDDNDHDEGLDTFWQNEYLMDSAMMKPKGCQQWPSPNIRYVIGIS